MADASNARPIAIFAGYMLTAATLTAACIGVTRKAASRRENAAKNSTPRLKLVLFGVLASISLGTTWYHMFRFFEWSYLDWSRAQAHDVPGDSGLRLGEWLRDTTLFRQAWGSTLEAPARAWWCLQIFGFCANWSVMLAAEKRRGRVPLAWAFMLLGQVVAISFATNLFFLAVLTHDAVPTTGTSSTQRSQQKQRPRRPAKLHLSSLMSSASFWYDVLIVVNVGIAMNVPRFIGKPGFMKLLLAPHLLAFAPLVVNWAMPAREANGGLEREPSLVTKVGCMVALVATASFAVAENGGSLGDVVKALHEHPAVSSVGWDVICCWVSHVAWYFLGPS